MPTIRLTSFFRDDDANGWSEQHDVDGGATVTSLAPYIQAFDNFNQNFRRPLLAGDGYYIGCRASYRTADGRIAAVPLLHNPPKQGTVKVGTKGIGMDKASTAVKISMTNAANTATTQIYVRGIWDECVNFGQLDFGSALGSQWKALADQYVGALIQSGYGWLGINPTTTPRGTVSGYVENPDGTITFTVGTTNGVMMPTTGSKVQVNFARINRSRSILNRTLVCTVESATSLKTVQLVSASEFETKGTFIIPIRGLIPYSLATYMKLSSRKCGRPFGLTPGRRAALTLH